MTKKGLLIGGIAVLALAVPAIAQIAKPDRPTQTRAGAEAKVRTYFARIDADKDGFVTAQDMSVMRGVAMGNLFDLMDADKNGSLSRTEFDSAHAGGGKHRMGGGHGMKMGRGGGRLMMMADADKDGRVALSEAVTGTLTMFDRADANKDGTLTADERRAARQAMRAAWRAKTAG